MHLFPLTLPALFGALNDLERQFEVIIVDDCSSDNSVQYLQDNYPQVSVITNSTNSGFSKTINRGIHASKHELVLLLNSDVKLTPNYFADQIPYFKDSDTFGVMGKIIGWDDDIVQDAAKYPKFQGFKLKTSFNYTKEFDVKRPLLSMYLSGANALVDRVKLLSLGGFNELYSPFYMEDVDLSIRAWRVGWKCYFEPSAICRHRTSATISSKEKKHFVKTIYNRNKMIFHAIHLQGVSRAGWYIQTCFELIVRTLLLQFYYIKSFLAFIKAGAGVTHSRLELDNISRKTGVKLSLHSVTAIIKSSVSKRKIIIIKR